MRTIKHNFTQKVPRGNIPCDTPSKPAMSKDGVSSALLGGYSAQVERSLAAGGRSSRVGAAMQCEEDATGKRETEYAQHLFHTYTYTYTSSKYFKGQCRLPDDPLNSDIHRAHMTSVTGTGSGSSASADLKSYSLREDADAAVISDADIGANIGMVNNAYYVCVGFVTSEGETQSTHLIKVRVCLPA